MSIGVTSNAIVFFDGQRLAKEMLYPEFEAILDHVLAVDEFKGSQVKAAYVRVDERLHIIACVFFYIDFDASGFADSSWNIPLQHLADNAGRGPDLGAGPIRLSCRSQCSVSWHQRVLWDPVLETTPDNTLQILAAAIKRNRLGFSKIEEEISAKAVPADKTLTGKSSELEQRLTKYYKEELSAKLEVHLEGQKLRVATLKADAQDRLTAIQQHYLSEQKKQQSLLESTKQLFAEEKHRSLRLKKTIEAQAKDLHQAREGFQQQLISSQAVDQQQLKSLQESYTLELKSSVKAATAQLKETLDMREVELFYREDKVKRLNEEVTGLRQEKQALLDGSGDRMLQRLVNAGITFVAYQPGVEHLTVPATDMAGYLESPLNYVAEKCSVDKAIYQHWISHYQLAVCNYHDPYNGAVCGRAVPKVEKPVRFIIGESDRCVDHSRAGSALSELIKVREPS